MTPTIRFDARFPVHNLKYSIQLYPTRDEIKGDGNYYSSDYKLSLDGERCHSDKQF
jgi:hypothetical protein